jgi:uncharacterized protein (DUF39 family)
MKKTYSEINQNIKNKTVNVLTAEEMVDLVENEGLAYAAEEVDVVTTGTFGCMCSSGAFFNLKQPDPPIRIDQIFLDGVPAYHGNAAADFYLGVTKPANPTLLKQFPHVQERYPCFPYGGGHVLERLISGESVLLHATSKGTAGYPRKSFSRHLTLDAFNQAWLVNPRNAYQRYNCAINTSDKPIYTYMGKLLPNYRNATYGGVGTLSPLNNDPCYRTIGLGTRIFLAGGTGYILGEGTQHHPSQNLGTIMVKGNINTMTSSYLAGASITKYGVSCFIGLGIPIPILDDDLAYSCARTNSNIYTEVVDYSSGTRDRPTLRSVSYQTLQDNRLTLNGHRIPVSSTSSWVKSRQIAKTLKTWITQSKFTITRPITSLPTDSTFESLSLEET